MMLHIISGRGMKIGAYYVRVRFLKYVRRNLLSRISREFVKSPDVYSSG